MKWTISSPTSWTSDTGAVINRAPEAGFVTDGMVCYSLYVNSKFRACIWCEDTQDERNATLNLLRGLVRE
jgi:hypothetical protein